MQVDKFFNLFRKSGAGQLQLIAGLLLLALAYVVTLSFPGTVNPVHLTPFFLTYEMGYVNRGFMGNVFQLVHGHTTVEKVYKFLPLWDKCVLVAVVFLFWAMFIPRIWMSNFSLQNKWMLMAFASVPILAPIWKEVGSQVGQLDEWVLIWVLLAFFCFLYRRPIGYLCCIFPAFLVHPQALFYALLILMLIIHAVVRNQEYAARWRIWIAVGVLPMGFSGLLALLHSADIILAFVEANRQEFLKALPVDFFENLVNVHKRTDSASGYTGIGYRFARARWELWPYSAITGIIGYGLPILAYGLLFSYGCGKAAGTCKSSFLALKHPILEKIIPYERYIIVVSSIFFALPTFFLGDWGRTFYWSWFSIGIASAYFVWFQARIMPVEKKVQKAKKARKAKKRKKVAGYLFSGFMALWGYTFAGAPLVLGNLTDPNLYNYEGYGYFHPFLNKHPLGDFYAESVYKLLLVGNAVDVHADARDVYFLADALYLENHFKLEKDMLIVPADFEGKIWYEYTRFPRKQEFSFILNHGNGASGRFMFAINNHNIEPAFVSENKTVWRAWISQDQLLLRLGLFAGAGRETRIKGFDIDFH